MHLMFRNVPYSCAYTTKPSPIQLAGASSKGSLYKVLKTLLSLSTKQAVIAHALHSKQDVPCCT